MGIKAVHMRTPPRERLWTRKEVANAGVSRHDKLQAHSLARTLISALNRLGQFGHKKLCGHKHLDKNIHGIAEEVAVGDLDGTLPPAINKTTAAFSANKAGTGLVKSKHCLLRTKDKNVMGGNPPKRSNMQSKLDPNSDFR
ncbi:hypothetical protein AaE_012825 [Aphanomyces astaci]|uniref:Uncharacterized protein n=1 Tax=Aphanomyces astaci TaxID=112090 RepID=A0A6A4ZDM6_APHAT|nr:hypothetical protein AaE_012825 [Aphanomyces astaci]